MKRNGNHEDLTQVLKDWEESDRSPVRWQSVEFLCYELAKVSNSFCMGPSNWGEAKEWTYLSPANTSVNVSATPGPVWGMQANASRGSSHGLTFISHEDHWVRTWLWVLSTLGVFRYHGQPYPVIEKIVRARLESMRRLQKMTNQILPKAVYAYEKVRGFSPELGKLSVSFSDVVPPEGKVAVYQRIAEGESPLCQGAISLHPKTVYKHSDLRYLTIVLTHEIIHYVLNNQSGNDPHGGEFQAVANLLGIPPKFQD